MIVVVAIGRGWAGKPVYPFARWLANRLNR